MPEPDFLTPTVYTPTPLTFGNLLRGTQGPYDRNTRTGPPRRGGKRRKPQPTAPSFVGGFLTRRPNSPAPSSFLLDSLYGRGNENVYKTNDDYSLDAVNTALSYPSVNTVKADGGNSNFLNALKGTAAAILANMGSGGDDGEVTTFTPASFDNSQSDNILGDPVVLIGLVVGAGVLIYMVNK